MIEAIVIHGAWWVFGFFCGFFAASLMAMAGAMSRLEEAVFFAPGDDEKPKPAPTESDELTKAKETAAFYQDLYFDLVNAVKRT